MITQEQEKMIESVIERFDFDKAHAYMVLRDWRNMPTKKDLIKYAKELLETVMASKSTNIGVDHNHGIAAYKDPSGRPHLFFFIEHKTNAIEQRRPIT